MKVQNVKNQQSFQAKSKNFITLPKALLTEVEKKARATSKVSPYIGDNNEALTSRMLQRLQKKIQKGKVQRLVQNPQKVNGYEQTKRYKEGGRVVVLATMPTKKGGLPAKIFKFSPKSEQGTEIQRTRLEDSLFDEVVNALNAIG